MADPITLDIRSRSAACFGDDSTNERSGQDHTVVNIYNIRGRIDERTGKRRPGPGHRRFLIRDSDHTRHIALMHGKTGAAAALHVLDLLQAAEEAHPGDLVGQGAETLFVREPVGEGEPPALYDLLLDLAGEDGEPKKPKQWPDEVQARAEAEERAEIEAEKKAREQAIEELASKKRAPKKPKAKAESEPDKVDAEE